MNPSKAFRLFLFVTITFSVISCKEEKEEQGEQEEAAEAKQQAQQPAEQEREVTEDEMPAAVLAAYNQAYPGATVRGYSEEIEEGQTFHEVSFEFEGRKFDVVYHPDGKVKVAEIVIAHDQLPAAAHQAISKEFPRSSIQLAEELDKEGKKFYEAQVLNMENNKSYEMVFSESGILIETKPIPAATTTKD